MKNVVPAVLIVAIAFAVGGASPGATAAHERDLHFEMVGRAFKGINDQLKQRPPNLVAIRNTSAVLATMASRTKTWFPAGSGPQNGVKTNALPAAWTNRAELDRKADAFAAAAGTLATTAQGSDIAAIQAAVRATGETCKSCHDQFRKRQS
ncbi:MAG: hypothetical protein JWQ16_767 [Novosphingobium sp.]|nr:hypothetical protein [Novosphingobium sp.]